MHPLCQITLYVNKAGMYYLVQEGECEPLHVQSVPPFCYSSPRNSHGGPHGLQSLQGRCLKEEDNNVSTLQSRKVTVGLSKLLFITRKPSGLPT